MIFKGFLFPVGANLCIKMFTWPFFQVLPTAQSQGTWTNFHAKYVPGKDVPFRG